MKTILFLLSLFIFSNTILAQKSDTITINPSTIEHNVLKSGVNRYLVYFKKGKDSSRISYQLWTRKVDYITYKNKKAISITQEWENNDTIFHKTYSVCDEKSFQPFLHEVWNRNGNSTSFSFLDRKAIRNNKSLEKDTSKTAQNMLLAFNKSLDQYCLNWHLDLEVFSLLPYKAGTTFRINFYDPGFDAPQYVYYSVTGSGKLNSYGHEIDCWLLSHEDKEYNNKEVFWINKKTKEVMKLEQEYKGKYRFKIKLPFSV